MQKKFGKVFPILVLTVMGAIGGYLIGYTLSSKNIGGYLIGYTLSSKNISILEDFMLFLSLPLFYIVHIIIHEAGHALFGKIKGYKMVSYRIFSLMWSWQEDGTIHFRRYKVPGTLGQCLMAPAKYEPGKFPFRFYLLGGVLANLVTSILVGIFFMPQFPGATLFVIIGILIALVNLIPIGFNDGMSLKIAASDERQQYLLYLQLEVNYQLNKGKSYVELPEQYFQLINETSKHTYFNDWQEFLILARLAEEHSWTHYQKQLEILWNRKEKLVSIYLLELTKEMLFSLCLTAPDDKRISQIWADKKIIAALKQPLMGNKRVEAAYAYYIEKNSKSALEIIKSGKKLVNRAPNPGDAKMEGDLLRWLEINIIAGTENSTYNSIEP